MHNFKEEELEDFREMLNEAYDTYDKYTEL